MHSYRVGNVPSGVTSAYGSSTLMSNKSTQEASHLVAVNRDNVEPINFWRGMSEPHESVRSRIQNAPASALPQVRPCRRQDPLVVVGKFTRSGPWDFADADTATEPPQMNTPFPPVVQPSPTLGPLPGPSTHNTLRSPISVSSLSGACQWTSGESGR